MKKMIAILLSFVLVLSNISLTYATHFCGGKAIENQLMIGIHDLSCGMIMPETSCDSGDLACSSPAPEELNSNCCDNEYIPLSVDDDFNIGSKIQLPNLDFLAIFTFINWVNYNQPSINKIAWNDHSPPLVKRNILVLLQVFLI